jgi:hypothetical protein
VIVHPLIEDYLRANGVRYFRGHHDDEYFFLVDFLVDAGHGRLHVHLAVGGLLHDTVQIVITPDRYYPADKRDRLAGLAARWTVAGQGAEAVVRDSCDPTLIGISVEDLFRPTSGAGLADLLDQTIASAIQLFEQVSLETLPSSRVSDILRDAG